MLNSFSSKYKRRNPANAAAPAGSGLLKKFDLMISFFLSEGVETPMKDGEFLSASGSKLVETGIRTFYLLTTIALGLMIYSGLIKILKK